LTLSEEDGSVVIRVRDNGPGMDPEVLKTVFDLFVQGPPPVEGRPGGLGLGLTLVRRLVEMQGGTVEGASAGPGRGSEFTVRLPAAAPAEGETEAPPRVPESSGSPRRVLVVDDNLDAREALRFLLEDEGHGVATAADGPQALEQARSFVPEIVLLDIGLPGMDGYEVARRLRAVPGCADAAIVAVSGYGQAEDRARSRAAGFDDHLLKPVAPDLLLQIVSGSRRRDAASGRR
jgi:two-component system CheB/CheR fusion protein